MANRYEATMALLAGLTLSNFDREQLATVETNVLRLMAEARPRWSGWPTA